MDYSPTSINNMRFSSRARTVPSCRPLVATALLIWCVDCLVTQDGLLVNGRANRGWVRNLHGDPRTSALIHDHADVSHWVRIGGAAELVREGDEAAVDDAKAMARRYGDDPEQFIGQRRVTWRLVADRVLERGG